MRKKVTILIALCITVALTFCLYGCQLLTAAQASGGTIPQNEDTPVTVAYVISFDTGTSQTFDSLERRILNPSEVPVPSSSYKSGYRFEGWYLTSDYSGSMLVFPYTFTRNTTLYAKWIPNSTIRISTAEQLAAVSADLNGRYALSANIDLSHIDNWAPIGGELNKPFTGSFDGNGYTVSGMNIKDIKEDEEFNYMPIGLFGKVTGTLRNVTVVDYRITLDGDRSRFYIGAVAGWLFQGEMVNCSSQGVLSNPEIVYSGNMWDSLFGSYAEPTELTNMGGAIGLIEESTASNIGTSGTIVSYTNAEGVYLGGVVGYIKSGSLTGSNSTVNVTGRYAGGLAGYNDGSIVSCFALGNTEGSLSYPAISGGLVSYNFTSGTISRSYATGNAKARTAGGLVGVNVFDYATAVGGTITNCYATGDVFASEYAGGLIGRAVSDLPVFGREQYSEKIYSPTLDRGSSYNRFYMVTNCISYGDVVANAAETIFKDYLGNVSTANVFYPVFAGSLIGQANELLITGCIAFGDVSGTSHREAGDEYTFNSAYVDNLVGHSSTLTTEGGFRYVFAIQDMTVTRNYVDFTGFNSVPEITYELANNSSYLRNTLGFDGTIWNLNNLDTEAGIVPVLL